MTACISASCESTHVASGLSSLVAQEAVFCTSAAMCRRNEQLAVGGDSRYLPGRMAASCSASSRARCSCMLVVTYDAGGCYRCGLLPL